MRKARAAAILCFALMTPSVASAVGSSFTYQGRLEDSGTVANGPYDLEFKLYDGPSSGLQKGGTIVAEDVNVARGVFTVSLDFGSPAFDGGERWLEVGVRPGASTGAFTALVPRQPVTAAPYALHAAVSGDLACTGCVSPAKLGFDPATQAELDAHTTSGDHDGRYARLAGGNSLSGNQTVTGDVSATGTLSAQGVKVGSTSSACLPGLGGTMRYDSAAKQVEFCDGTAWRTLAGPPGASGILHSGQVTWALSDTASCCASWTNVGVPLNITTSGGPLLITIDTYLSGGSHATCRPTIDGAWAGSFGGLASPGDPYWQEGLTYIAAGGWHPWHKTRLYPGVPAGSHVLRVQCATDSGTVSVGATSIPSSLHFVELSP